MLRFSGKGLNPIIYESLGNHYYQWPQSMRHKLDIPFWGPRGPFESYDEAQSEAQREQDSPEFQKYFKE